MNGAMALDCEKTISRPNNTTATTIGTSQYFFSCRRNWKNSPSTRDFAMNDLYRFCNALSEHPHEMFAVAETLRVHRPAGIRRTTAAQRIAADEPPEKAKRRQNHKEQEREQQARVDPAEHHCKRPPGVAWPFEPFRHQRSAKDQHRADHTDDFRASDSAPPRERNRYEQQHGPHRQPKRSLAVCSALSSACACHRASVDSCTASKTASTSRSATAS